MSNLPRFHCPTALVPEQVLNLPSGTARHVQVLRLQPNDEITLFNGQGGEYKAVITHMGRSDVSVRVGEHNQVERELSVRVTLWSGITANERMDWLLEKATELGASALLPITAERSVLKLKGDRADKKWAHWQGIAVASSEQCGRNRVPVVKPLLSLRDWLDEAAAAGGTRLLLAPDGPAVLRELQRPAGMVTVLAGPEGGFTSSEAADAQRFGFQPLRLGPRVLRTETAAVALLAAMQALWGDF